MVENKIVYDAGVRLGRDSPYWTDDRDEKVKFFRSLVGSGSEAEKEEMSALLESTKASAVNEPVGFSNDLPQQSFLETETPSASTMFEDMMRCGPKRCRSNEPVSENILHPKDISGSVPEAYDPASKNAETYEEVSEPPTSSCSETALSNAFDKYRNIYVFNSTDEFGRTYYLLDDSEQQLRIVVFSVQDVEMVSLNEVVMSLDHFLSMSQAKGDLDSKGEYVRLRIGNELLDMYQCSVPMMLMALTVLDRHQKGLAVGKRETDSDWNITLLLGTMVVTILLAVVAARMALLGDNAP